MMNGTGVPKSSQIQMIKRCLVRNFHQQIAIRSKIMMLCRQGLSGRITYDIVDSILSGFSLSFQVMDGCESTAALLKCYKIDMIIYAYILSIVVM